MTIAEQIKFFHTELNKNDLSLKIKNINDLEAECTRKAISSNLDDDQATKMYKFSDKSILIIVYSTAELFVYSANQ